MTDRQLGGFQFKIGTAADDGGKSARQCLDLGIEYSTQAWVSKDWGPGGSKELFDLEVGGKQSWMFKWPIAAPASRDMVWSMAFFAKPVLSPGRKITPCPSLFVLRVASGWSSASRPLVDLTGFPLSAISVDSVAEAAL